MKIKSGRVFGISKTLEMKFSRTFERILASCLLFASRRTRMLVPFQLNRNERIVCIRANKFSLAFGENVHLLQAK